MRRLAALTVIALFAGTACWPFGGDDALAEMSLRRVQGKIQVIRGEEVLTVGNEIDLEPLDVIKSDSNDALADLRLKGVREIQLTGHTQVRIVDETTVEAQAGRLLATAGERMTVRFGEVDATSSDAIFRVDQGFGSTRAAAYTGLVALSAPGERPLRVSQYFQAQIAAGDIPSDKAPYRLDTADPWDRQYMKSYVKLEEDLARYQAALSNNLTKDRPGLPYFRALSGEDRVDFLKPYLRSTAVEDLLIGFNVALQRGPLARSFREAFGYFEDGASWGVVAAIMDIEPQPLLADIEDVFLGTGVVAQGPNNGAEFDALAAAAGAAPPSSGTGPDPGNDPDDKDDNIGGPDPGPKPKPTDEPEDCSGTVDCAVKDLTEPEPEPSPSPSESDLLDGVLDD